MKRFLLPILVCVAAVSCSQSGSGGYLTINGTINPSFDGYSVFFRPQPYPTADVVDSCRITHGKFQFRIPADTLSVGDVMLSYAAPMRVEPLLIAVEPGTLTMELGTDSHASGTPLNDSLAVWKKFIEENVQGRRDHDLVVAQEVFNRRTADFIKSQPNALGGYLFFMFSPQFPGDLVMELDSLGMHRYLPDVTKRKFKYNR